MFREHKLRIRHEPLLRIFGGTGDMDAGALWRGVADAVVPAGSASWKALNAILEQGALSTRIRRSLERPVDIGGLRAVYRRLADCLCDGRMFGADG